MSSVVRGSADENHVETAGHRRLKAGHGVGVAMHVVAGEGKVSAGNCDHLAQSPAISRIFSDMAALVAGEDLHNTPHARQP